jgi:RNA-directed DNA polymerase
MKRQGFLFEKIIAFSNLQKAYKKALKGRRYTLGGQQFYFHLEYELLSLLEELKSETYRMRPYFTFTLYDPKRREIASPCFRDHLVAHAIHEILYPVLDRSLISDSYASRLGKGTHKALLKTQLYSRSFSYFLKLDIQKYFASIDHQVLQDFLKKKLKDAKVLNLIETILSERIPYYPEGKGVALGHLLSQIFSNFYLNEMDHQIKERFQIKGYVRYMDDLLLFGNSKTHLKETQKSLEEYLLQKLQLSFKKEYNLLSPSSCGIPFLGFLIFPYLIRLRNKTLRRGRKTLKCIENSYRSGRISEATLQQQVGGFLSHLLLANSYQLRQKWLVEHSLED